MKMQFTKTKQASFRNSKEEGKAARLLSLLLLRVRCSGCQRHSAWYHSINQLLHEEQQTRTSSRMKSRQALTLLHTAHNNLSASQRFHRSWQMQHGPKKHSAMCPHITVYQKSVKFSMDFYKSQLSPLLSGN